MHRRTTIRTYITSRDVCSAHTLLGFAHYAPLALHARDAEIFVLCAYLLQRVDIVRFWEATQPVGAP